MSDQKPSSDHVECRCAECDQVKAYRAELAERRLRLQAEADGKPSLAADAPAMLELLRRIGADIKAAEEAWDDETGLPDETVAELRALLDKHGRSP